ncbi:MAG: hypothetical protein ACRCUJ_12930 [Phocaeicola sp.]
MKHKHITNEDNFDMVSIYDSVKEWLGTDFSITRMKAEDAKNLPFSMIIEDWLFLIKTPTSDGMQEYYVGSLDMDSMMGICEEALMWSSHFKDSMGRPSFIEEFWPRECKWNPDCPPTYITHYNLLADEMGTKEEDYEGGVDIMLAFLQHRQDKARNEQRLAELDNLPF